MDAAPTVSGVPAGGPARGRHGGRRGGQRGGSALVATVALACCAVLLGACGSSTPTTTTSPAQGARTKITDDWKTFFAGSTSAKVKVSLLENGASFATIIDAQASTPMAEGVAASVSKVTLTSSTTATVAYSLTVGGKPALTNQTGEAVLQDGTWKVGTASFCALLALEQVKAPGCQVTS